MNEPTATAAVGRRTSQVMARVFFAGYIVVLLLIVFWPTPVDRGAEAIVERIVAFVNRRGIESFRYRHVEWLANIVLFVPFGCLLTFIVRRWWVAPLAGMLLSAGIEFAQRYLLTERFASPYDVAANGIGAILGALLALAMIGAKRIGERSP